MSPTARTARVHLSQTYPRPVEEVFAVLADHDVVGRVFGTGARSVRRIVDGQDSPNGVGSVRRLTLGPVPPFEETITELEPLRRIGYRISKGTPLRDHRGLIELSPTPEGGTALEYTITFGAAVPGLAPVVAAVLTAALRRGLAREFGGQ